MFVYPAIKAHLKQTFSSKEKQLSAPIILIIELIAITPLCGYLIQCGCDWPWLGLDDNCNFHRLNIKYQCPWCISMLMGILSTGLAIIMGLYVSSLSLVFFVNINKVKEILSRISLGLIAFVLTAMIMAIVAASQQGYPLPNYLN